MRSFGSAGVKALPSPPQLQARTSTYAQLLAWPVCPQMSVELDTERSRGDAAEALAGELQERISAADTRIAQQDEMISKVRACAGVRSSGRASCCLGRGQEGHKARPGHVWGWVG